ARWARACVKNQDTTADRAETAVDAAAADITPGRSLWRDVLEQSVIVNLRELVAILTDIKLLAQALPNPARLLPARFAEELAAHGKRSLHRDLPLAFLSA